MRQMCGLLKGRSQLESNYASGENTVLVPGVTSRGNNETRGVVAGRNSKGKWEKAAAEWAREAEAAVEPRGGSLGAREEDSSVFVAKCGAKEAGAEVFKGLG